MTDLEKRQRSMCERFGAVFSPPEPGSRLGIGLQTLGQVPLHGVRHLPVAGTCGWYVWAGDWSDDPDFYTALCVEHLPDHLVQALDLLALPPGWRFLMDNKGYLDVWFDEEAVRA
ncbi:MAG: immunity protein Imm33 domain-containing protein [bacterium]